MLFFDQSWFSAVRRPSRYLGHEINQIKKDQNKVEISIALAFPDLYEVGMSHLGLKILYHILNGPEWLAAERVFCPWIDLEQELRRRGLPLTALESGRPLSSFDLVGFSLQYELSYTNILTMLELSRIPFLAEQRGPDAPLLVAGGPVCFNPEPIAPLFDMIVIGDGEEAALEICQYVRQAKKEKGKTREDLLRDLTGIRGVYIPRFFEPRYRASGKMDQMLPNLAHYQKVEKAVVPDLDSRLFPTSPIVPFTELIHDRLAIEIARGCTRGCRFCQAGMIYRPVRERHGGSILKIAAEALAATGYEELSLLSLSAGDHSCIRSVLKSLMDRFAPKKIAVNFPSLRIDSLDAAWFDEIKRVRKTGFTLAPEAGNDRLRRVINKNLTDLEILSATQKVYQAGWRLIKLYFMIGLPTENEKDIQDIIRLTREIAASQDKKKSLSLHISLSTFVPKSHTPFMWHPQISREESKKYIRLVQEAFHRTRITVKANDPAMSWLEGIFARGDRKIANVLISAWHKGARFDAWGEQFNIKIWEEAFQESGLDVDLYLNRFTEQDEILPWDHIQSGVHKRFFQEEYHKALAETSTPDCRSQCLHCGVCDHQRIMPRLAPNGEGPWLDTDQGEALSSLPAGSFKKYRLVFSKRGRLKFLSHLELGRLLVRVFKRAGLDLIYSQGYHPLPKISFYAALPVGLASLHETIDIQISEQTGSCEETLQNQINRELPEGIRIHSVEDITARQKTERLRETEYLIEFEGIQLDQSAVRKFLSAQEFSMMKSGKNGSKCIDARPLVKSIELIASDKMNLRLSHGSGSEIKPIDLVVGIFHLDPATKDQIKIMKTNEFIN